MESPARWIILSPHLDDGVLSCGGLAAALSPQAEVQVWTLFCGAPTWGPYSPIAQWLHGISGDATGSRLARLRRKEDHAACQLLGAGQRHFLWRDAAYRRGRDGGFLYNECRQEKWQSEDEPMISDIAAALRKELSSGDYLLVPLAVGGHVDHLIARRAAEQCGHTPLAFYPEVPYVQLHPEDVKKQTTRLGCSRYAVTPEQTDEWVAAVQCYASQRRMLEEADGPLPELIQNYARGGGLQLYHDGPASNAALGKLLVGVASVP